MPKILINSQFFEHKEALIHVEERGFRFGDGVFETIGIYGGLPYLWHYHQERLEAGLRALRITFDTHALLLQAMGLLVANRVKEGLLRISISRGVGSRGYLPLQSIPTLVMETLPYAQAPKEAMLWLSSYEKISPRALPTHCKLAQGLNSTLARMEATENNCYDALQRSMHGHIAETSSANIFWLTENVLFTPSLATGALGGTTRRRICELSLYKVEEGEYSVDALRSAEAVIITNAAVGIVAVSGLNPLGLEWQSDALAENFIELRKRDIASDVLGLRELLAQT
jgi:branched-subunit amino acid aminotransferase/4-amino-4-deoxychorismate lyase